MPAEHAQRNALLQLFMLDKAFYELNYELNNRPDWYASRSQLFWTSSAAGSGIGVTGFADIESTCGRAPTAGTARDGRFGASPERDGVRFQVLALSSRQLQLRLSTGVVAGAYPLEPHRDDTKSCFVRGAGAGDRYVHSIDGPTLGPIPSHASSQTAFTDLRRMSTRPPSAGSISRGYAAGTRADPLRAARRHIHPGATFTGRVERLRHPARPRHHGRSS